jgi:DNA-binding YbaB/EbfC family protein
MAAEVDKKNEELKQMVKVINEKMLQIQNEARYKTVVASSGGGMVRVEANGVSQIVSVTINKQVVNPDDTEMLADLIIAAVNQALADAQAMIIEEVARVTAQVSTAKILES